MTSSQTKTSGAAQSRAKPHQTDKESPVMELNTAIEQVETLYRTVTGTDAPPPVTGTYAPIPPEQDPQRYISEQFDRLASMLGGDLRQQQPPRLAELNVWESDKAFLVCVDLPGVDRKSVTLAVEGNIMKVTAHRSAPDVGGDLLRPRMLERHAGDIAREIVLPWGVEAGPFEARLVNGVLEITVPKLAPAQTSKSITIN